MTNDIASLVADNLDLWTSATARKSGAGRGGGGKRISLYGIERLRALILDLAVRGKLVPQDAGDEPASELVKRIVDEQASGTYKKRVTSKLGKTPISDEIPTGWEKVQVGDVFSIRTGFAFKSSTYSAAGTLVFRVTNFDREGRVDLSDTVYFPTEEIDGKLSGFLLEEEDIIMVMVGGTIGKTTIVDRSILPALLNQNMWRIRSFGKQIFSRYEYFLVKMLNSKIEGLTQSTHGHFAIGNFTKRMVLIPPLAEQRRIVAKVDELMALCDALERESADAMAAHQALVEALLATLVRSANAAELATNWARLEQHFDTLFTTDASIDALKQTILDLAVRGKLVEQDAGDEAAEMLVQNWKKAKSKALMSAGDRRIKAAADPKAPPFSIPSHWAFQSFENIFLFIDYRGNTPAKTDDGIPLITAKNVRMGYLDREPREYISEETFPKWMTRGFPQIDDLFFTTEAPLGNICQNNIEAPFAIAQRLICFRPYGDVDTRFFMFAIMSRSMQQVLDDHATGMTARGIKAAKLKLIALPVPPLAEQHRIVAKVDALMALCDALKARITEAATTQKHLADAITERAAA